MSANQERKNAMGGFPARKRSAFGTPAVVGGDAASGVIHQIPVVGKRSRVAELKRDRKQHRIKEAIRRANEKRKRKPGAVAKATGPVEELKLLIVDEQFAPQVEELCLQYSIRGLEQKKVKLEVTSARSGASPIYVRELANSEKSTGHHAFTWDGKTNKDAGGLKKESFINPLHSPFKAKIYAEGTSHSVEVTFKVLYHSVALKQGPWTADEEEPKQTEVRRYVQYRLNELGYFGGPVGKDTAGYLRKAIARYQYHNRHDLPNEYRRRKGRITRALRKALADPESERRFVVEDDAFTDASKTSHIVVEALSLEKQIEILYGKNYLERKRLNRPLIPVEATIYLKGKGGQKKLAPKAVGPVRINWRFEDPKEDLTAQYSPTPTQPTRAKAYIESCMPTAANAADNAPRKHGGIRDRASRNYYRPALLGNYLVPYRVRRDRADRVIYSKAHNKEDSNKKRQGKAGFFFRPSLVAGDDYRITAEIDFKGESNKAALETDHGVTSDINTRIHFKSGTFRIQRRHAVAMLINWPGTRGGLWKTEKAQVKADFAKAHLLLDDTNIAEKKITEVITAAEYTGVVRRYTRHRRSSLISLNEGYSVGVALPKQGNTEVRRYQRLLYRFCDRDFMVKIRVPLQRLISKNIRGQHPEGIVMVNYRCNKPMPIRYWNSADPRGQAMRRTLMQMVYQPAIGADPRSGKGRTVVYARSEAHADSLVYICQDSPRRMGYTLAHELGHLFWLRHWQHTKDGPRSHHDRSDSNCTMSYTSESCTTHGSHHKAANFKPHFCGKCNLRLRGWRIRKLPARS